MMFFSLGWCDWVTDLLSAFGASAVQLSDPVPVMRRMEK